MDRSRLFRSLKHARDLFACIIMGMTGAGTFLIAIITGFALVFEPMGAVKLGESPMGWWLPSVCLLWTFIVIWFFQWVTD